MKNRSRDFAVADIEGQWVVIDRQTWEQERPGMLLSLIGSSRLAAGPFATEEEAEAARERLLAG